MVWIKFLKNWKFIKGDFKMSCKYNTAEFRQFISNHQKIKPAVTDDWVLINETLNTTIGIALRSDKLDTTIYDISFRPFINFLKEENVVMNGNKIVGEFAIGVSRVLRKGSDFNETMTLRNGRLKNTITKNKLIVGKRYESLCGNEITYLGSRYVMTFQDDVYYTGCYYLYNDNKFSKIKKLHYGLIDDVIYDISKMTMVLEIDGSITCDSADTILENYRNKYKKIICFTNNKPKNYYFDLIPDVISGKDVKAFIFIERNNNKYITTQYYKKLGMMFEFEITHLGLFIDTEKVIPMGMKQSGFSKNRHLSFTTYQTDDQNKILNERINIIVK